MSGYIKTLTLSLAAASANNIALSQTKGSAGNLTLNGSTVSGGVATLDVPRRVLITTASDNSAVNFTITGTGINGLAQTEIIAGPTASGTVFTTKDFGTITSIAVSAALTGNITIGTNGVGSTAPMIIDRYINPNLLGAAIIVSGAVTCSLEQSYDDLIPQWDINGNTTTWFGSTGFTAVTENQDGNIQGGPFTMLRLTVTAGTGTATAKILTPFRAGAI